jgi:molybdenum cofactor cytidylyltransferase/nicotine blue oxidoreductase
MGRPKALILAEAGESWPARAARILHEGGCDDVVVVLGADAEEAWALLPANDWLRSVTAGDYPSGLSRSLVRGLAAVSDHPADAVGLTLADLPTAVPGEFLRLLGREPGAALPPAGTTTLRRAVHAGVPGHPVVIGRDHWASVAAEARGDRGAGPYLRRHGAELVECGDLSDGRDADSPDPPQTRLL